MGGYSQFDEDAVMFTEYEYSKKGFLQLENLRENDEFCDITIRSTDGQQIRAHKVVLAARIPYFKATFSSGLFQSDEVVLDSRLFKFNESGIENVIQYAYFGQIVCSKELTDIFNTIVFADYLQIQSLKEDGCEALLISEHVGMETCVDVANIAKTYSCSSLLEKCLLFLGTNWEHIINHPTWVNLNFDVLSDLLKADKMNAYNEYSILNAVIYWVEHEASRKSFLPSLLSDVHLSKLSPSFIESLQRHSLLRDNSECLTVILNQLGWVSSDTTVILAATSNTADRIPSPKENDGIISDQNKVSVELVRKSKKAKVAERTYFGNCMYVLGGNASFKTLNTGYSRDRYDTSVEFERFNGMNENWAVESSNNNTPKSISRDIVGAGVSIYNNTIFMVGGKDEDNFHAFSYFDVSKDRSVKNWIDSNWLPIGKDFIQNFIRQKLCDTSASCIEDNLVVAGGQSSITPTRPVWLPYKYKHDDLKTIASVYLYNIPAHTWTVGQSLKHSRMYHQMATLRNKVYCVGGFPNSGNEVYDICLDKWSTSCNMLEQRSEHALVATDSRLVAIGGRSIDISCVGKNMGLNIFTTEYYDPRMKGWMKYVDMPIRSRGFTASELQGEIYLLGGYGCLGDRIHDQDFVYEVYILDQRSNKWRLGPEAPVSRMHGYSMVIP